MKTTIILAIVAIISVVGAVAEVSGMSMLTADHSQLAYASAGDVQAKCKASLLSGAVCNAATSQSNVNTGNNFARSRTSSTTGIMIR
jgi:hypothetical protein